MQEEREQRRAAGGYIEDEVSVERAITITRPIEEVFAFWKGYANLPRFMRHLTSVETLGENHTRWTATGPAGVAVSWDAETTVERENEWIAWRSLDNADLCHHGSVRFRQAPGNRGTEVHVHLQYRPPAGRLGRGIAWLFGEEPGQQIKEDLRRLKQLARNGRDTARRRAWPASGPAGSRRPGDCQPCRRLARTRRRRRASRRRSRMRAACWHGRQDIHIEHVPDPQILNPRDAIIRITRTAICGSDLHLYNGFIPSMKKGDIVGHEFMGEVVETGTGVSNLRKGDRVVVPFPIACGHCEPCSRELYSLCENSNPNAWMGEQMWGYTPCGIFGYSHLMGGYPGGQAEYVRVPFADVGPLKVPDELSDEQVLFLSDIFPTGFMAAEACGIRPGDVVAVWGCGPVGQFAIKSAYMLGAAKVIAIDRFPYRLRIAAAQGGAETINYEQVSVSEALREMTAGRGPDHCIDAVGLEGHAPGLKGAYDKAKTMVMLETDRPVALREAIMNCRSGGTISVAGVYGGFIDKFPMGAIVNRALTIKSGQTHVQRYMRPLLERIRSGEIDPSFVITHRLSLDDVSEGYSTFSLKEDECLKVVMTP